MMFTRYLFWVFNISWMLVVQNVALFLAKFDRNWAASFNIFIHWVITFNYMVAGKVAERWGSNYETLSSRVRLWCRLFEKPSELRLLKNVACMDVATSFLVGHPSNIFQTFKGGFQLHGSFGSYVSTYMRESSIINQQS